MEKPRPSLYLVLNSLGGCLLADNLDIDSSSFELDPKRFLLSDQSRLQISSDNKYLKITLTIPYISKETRLYQVPEPS